MRFEDTQEAISRNVREHEKADLLIWHAVYAKCQGFQSFSNPNVKSNYLMYNAISSGEVNVVVRML